MKKPRKYTDKSRLIRPSKDSQEIVGSKTAFINLLKEAVKTKPFDKKTS